MATASWRTCRGHDGMWSPKLRPSRSIGRRVMAFQIFFQHGGRPPFSILKNLIFNHVTVIVVLTCCCVPNFIEIGSRVRPPPPDAHNCRMFNAPLLGNGRCLATAVAMATKSMGHFGEMMGCDHSSWVSVGPLVSEL